MKTQQITTAKATILVLDLPQNQTVYGVDNSNGKSLLNYSQNGMMSCFPEFHEIPPGNWQILGKGFINELTEVDFEKIVDYKETIVFTEIGALPCNVFRNYKEPIEYFDLECDQF